MTSSAWATLTAAWTVLVTGAQPDQGWLAENAPCSQQGGVVGVVGVGVVGDLRRSRRAEPAVGQGRDRDDRGRATGRNGDSPDAAATFRRSTQSRAQGRMPPKLTVVVSAVAAVPRFAQLNQISRR